MSMGDSGEYYGYYAQPANTPHHTESIRVGGFLAVAAGTITIVDDNGTVVITAMPVVAGFNRIGIRFKTPTGGVITTTVAGTILH